MTDACLLTSTFTKCLVEKNLSIAVIGNSVSYGAAFDGHQIESYYVHLAAWFRETFPEATITVNLGIIFAIGPEVQLFRMQDKALRHQPDLVVTEFGAANGAWGETGREITERATEGYVRRLRMLRPEADLLMNLGLCTTMMDDYRAGRVPASVAFQAAVAKHYDAVLTDPGTAIATRVIAGELWSAFMKDGIHPGPGGYALHGAIIRAELDRQYRLYGALPDAARRVQSHTLPPGTVHADPWTTPRLAPVSEAQLTGFSAGQSGRVSYAEAAAPGASGSFAPATGRIVGVRYHLPAPVRQERLADLDVRCDGAGAWKRLTRANEPRFPEEDDRANIFQRQFFGAYGLPLYSRRIDFRVIDDPAPGANLHPLRLAGFFVIE